MKGLTVPTACFFVSLFLLLSPAAAAAEKGALTLEEAQELAREQSPYLELARLEYQEAGFGAQAARRDYDDTDSDLWNARYQIRSAADAEGRAASKLAELEDDDPVRHLYEQEMRLAAQRAAMAQSSLEGLVSGRREQRHFVNLAEAQRLIARLQVEDRQRLLDRVVEERFFNLILLQENHHLLQDRLSQLVHLQQLENTRVSLGLSTFRGVAALGAQIQEFRRSLEELATLRTLASQELNLHLGRDADAPLDLRGYLVPREKPVHSGVDRVALRETSTYKALAEQIQVQEKRLQDLANEYSKGHPRYREAATVLERLRLEQAQALDSFSQAITHAYNRVQEKSADLRASEARLALAQDELEQARRKGELGLASRVEVREKELGAREAQISYNQAVYAYNMAVTDYFLAREGIVVSVTNQTG